MTLSQDTIKPASSVPLCLSMLKFSRRLLPRQSVGAHCRGLICAMVRSKRYTLAQVFRRTFGARNARKKPLTKPGRMYRLAGIVALAAFPAALASGIAGGHSGDSGRQADVAAIRHDLPILMSTEVNNVEPLVIEWVATDGYRALASWRASPFRGFATLAKRNGRWWWTGESARDAGGFWTQMTAPPQGLGKCFDSMKTPPSAKQIYDDGYINKATYAVSRGRWKTVQLSELKLVDCNRNGAESSSGDYFLRFNPRAGADGIRYAFGNPASQDRTDLEDRGGHYDFDLSARVDNTKKDARAGALLSAKLTLWAPFILDATETYTLDIPNASPPILGLRGTLQNNTLTFALPPFKAPLASILRGTISKAV
jgi:hypothetical protein